MDGRMRDLLNKHQDFTGPGIRWPEAKSILLRERNLFKVVEYFQTVEKGERWPELEEMLIRESNDSTFGASPLIDYILDRGIKDWPEADQAVLENSRSYNLLDYAINVLGRRWPEAEPEILKNINVYRFNAYARDFVGEWPEAEQVLLSQGSAEQLMGYVVNVRKAPWPEAEPRILKEASTSQFISYMKSSGRDYWPEAEAVVLEKAQERDWTYSLMDFIGAVKKRPWPEIEKFLVEVSSDSKVNTHALRRYVKMFPEREKAIRPLIEEQRQLREADISDNLRDPDIQGFD